jgi:hypothetical protein
MVWCVIGRRSRGTSGAVARTNSGIALPDRARVLRDTSMSIFAQAGVPPTKVKDLSPIPPELELFARIEGLVGEEALSAELDRIWERLRERAEHLGRDHKSPKAGAVDSG